MPITLPASPAPSILSPAEVTHGGDPPGEGPHTVIRPRTVQLTSRPTAMAAERQEDKLSRKSAKKAAHRPEKARFAMDGGRLRQHSIDAEPARNPVFDAIGRGLMTLGQKVRTRGVDSGRI